MRERVIKAMIFPLQKERGHQKREGNAKRKKTYNKLSIRRFIGAGNSIHKYYRAQKIGKRIVRVRGRTYGKEERKKRGLISEA